MSRLDTSRKVVQHVLFSHLKWTLINTISWIPRQIISVHYQQEPKIVSDRNLAVVVRQLALHCNLAAQIQKSLGSGREPYSSNWLERLRQIKRIRSEIIQPND